MSLKWEAEGKNKNEYGREPSAEEYELVDGLLENKTIQNLLKAEGCHDNLNSYLFDLLFVSP